MRNCPYCSEKIQDAAIKCRYCGEFLEDVPHPRGRYAMAFPGLFWSYEYRSQAELFSLPLIHVAYGVNPQTGLPRVARGVIAVGNFAIGLVAVGGFALGGFTLAGIGAGIFILGGIAIGVVAVGGIAIALHFALGGLAISGRFAIGGLGISPFTTDATCANIKFFPKFLKFLTNRCQ